MCGTDIKIDKQMSASPEKKKKSTCKQTTDL